MASPVTVEDVIWSHTTCSARKGIPNTAGCANRSKPSNRPARASLRMTFNADNRELALMAGMRPILSKAQWEGKDFANAPLQDIPIGSGPYVVSDLKAGAQVVLTRNPDYWGAEVPVVRGTNNFDQIKIDFYGDANRAVRGFQGRRDFGGARVQRREMGDAIQLSGD